MPDSPPAADLGYASDPQPDRAATTGMPRWVKVSAIVAVILVVLVVVMMLLGGPGDHGPRRHF